MGELARGGAGVVFKARDTRLGRTVAIKILMRSAAEDRAQKRFAREARALAQLRHPNVVAVHDVGDLNGRPYLVMEFVPGQTLQERLDREGPLQPEHAAGLIAKLARALDRAHQLRLLHRDVKPSNVLLDESGEPRLTDFGLTKSLDPDLDGTAVSRGGQHLGTPGYWPPEQAKGVLEEIGPTADVYGLGATLYATLTGEPPFQGETLYELISKTCDQAPVPPSKRGVSLDPRLERVLLRCLEKRPSDRYPSAGALAHALDEAVSAASRPRAARTALVATLISLPVAIGLGYWAGTRPPPADDAAASTSPAPPPSSSVASSPTPEPDRGDPVLDDLIERAFTEGRGGSLGKALELVDQALARSPDNPRAYHARGVAWLYQGDAERAFAEFDRALSLEPSYVDPLITRAEILLSLGEIERALDEVERARQAAPDHAGVYAMRGAIRDAIKDEPAALADYDQALELDPDHPEALHGRGLIRYRRGDYPGAKVDFDRVIEVDPAAAPAYVNRANLRANHFGDVEGALSDYATALKLSPGNPDFHFARGQLWLELSDDEKASEDFTAALESDPAHVLSLIQRGTILHRLGRLDASLQDLNLALKEAPNLPSALYARASLLIELDELPLAMIDLDRVLLVRPDWRPALIRKARVFLQLGDEEQAAGLGDRLIELDPEAANGWVVRGLAKELAGNLIGALADLDRAVELGPEDVTPRIKRARMRLDNADLEGALEDALAAEKLAPERPQPIVVRARVLALQGQIEEALALLDRAEQLDPNYAYMFLARADALLRAEKISEALDVASLAIDTDTVDARFRAQIGRLIDRLRRAVKAQQPDEEEPGEHEVAPNDDVPDHDSE